MDSEKLNPAKLEQIIIDRFNDVQHVEVIDESAGCGAKFSVIIVSPEFEGKSTLARHKMVNELLKNEIKDMHAFSQKPRTPSEWEKTKQEQS